MSSKLIALPAIAAALLVSACSSTTNPPVHEPSPLNYSALRLTPNGTLQTGTGTISGPASGTTVQVGNATYNIGTNVPPSVVGDIAAYAHPPAPGSTSGAGQYIGNYARAAIIADNDVHNQGVFVINGTETSRASMPNQTASYEGFWSIAASDARSASGQFDAAVNFDNRNVFIDLYDGAGNIPLGSGAGTVQGTGFSSTLNTSGQFQSTNVVDGQFYGPGAREMGGLINGTSDNARTAGAMLGSKR